MNARILLSIVLLTMVAVSGSLAATKPVDIENAKGPAGYWRVTKFVKDYRDSMRLWENIDITEIGDGSFRWVVTDHPARTLSTLDPTDEAGRYKFRKGRNNCAPDGTGAGTMQCGDVIISSDQKNLTLLLYKSDKIHLEAKRTPYYTPYTGGDFLPLGGFSMDD
jgi:hypothetical protein